MQYVKFDREHRLKGYDYGSVASYMVTFNTKDRIRCLSEIADRGLFLPPAVIYKRNGAITEKYIHNIPIVYDNVVLDHYVIMPDHVHILLTFVTQKERVDLARIVRMTKERVTKEIGESIWQLDFYDVIADNEMIFDRCYQYIEDNPAAWLTKREAEPFFTKE